ncbi:hypothetical protein GCM10027610_030700 [Dactylosporangium cerinum]
MTRTALRIVGCVALALAGGAGLLSPTAAWARRPAVVSTAPADGAALSTPPDRIELSMSGAPDPALSHLSVRDGGGAEVAGGDLTAAGHVLRRPVTVQGVGDFTVTYHVVLSNGEEAVGQLSFSVGTGAPPAARPANAAPETHQHGIDPLNAILLIVDGAVVFGVLLLLISRPGPRSQARRRLSGRDPVAE